MGLRGPRSMRSMRAGTTRELDPVTREFLATGSAPLLRVLARARADVCWPDLFSHDIDRFTRAWERLDDFSEQEQIAQGPWDALLARIFDADWPGPWIRIPPEQEDSDGS